MIRKGHSTFLGIPPLLAVLGVLFFVASADVVDLSGNDIDRWSHSGSAFVKFYASWCSHCKQLEPAWNHLGETAPPGVTIARVDCQQEKSACARFGVKGYPSLKLIKEGQVYSFYGRRDPDKLREFILSKYETIKPEPFPAVPPSSATDAPANGGASKEKSAQGEGSNKKETDKETGTGGGQPIKSRVAELGDGNFTSVISTGVWFIKFYAPWCGHCKAMEAAWEDFALLHPTDGKGRRVMIGQVDVTANDEIATAFDIRGLPTLKLLMDGNMYDHVGTRATEEWARFVDGGYLQTRSEKIPLVHEHKGPDHTILLDDSNFEHLTQAATGATTGDWFVLFFAPWCGHCKKLAPVWRSVAASLKGRINVAKVDATTSTETAERFGIKAFPSLIFLRHGKMYSYEGPRSASALEAFAEGGYEGLEPSPVPPVPSLVSKTFSAARVFVSETQTRLLEFCHGSPSGAIALCVIGFIGGISIALILQTRTQQQRKRIDEKMQREKKKS
uniref:Thioredoxin domain-containing protein n=1 Tax=Chromera velia CCMP2878 TaxID=1169474 RepID=A0A0G4I9M0_9ALVE|mmetsp:Transcript_42197/g.83277  ORF Transcript_42197/g.83277 Transcript_42197/m.83277 type:complete len:503 (+) Transcript_42197:286-1794(+)|eukprot:Cvel_12208.t1-p1 / transcript=Cvel_12208.t1 / gene=Cvel_12208 / organism=Chromera_velia_CCMP2878 / gene_product=Thioredoxin domain-containing protein 5, putative / transcript_product=Thioredoxin domain-containing protein 5, putative / location=Cvel_scaffold789:43854-50846(+) / protein_length=502 / sequence_SO=supercontig / SO=protein_coding / is_pseudo=false